MLLFCTLSPLYAYADEDLGVISITQEEMNEDAGKYIEKALKLAKEDEYQGRELTVEVPSGTYKLSRCLHIFSNTNLVLQKDTYLVKNFSDGNMLKCGLAEESNYGYSGYSNISVTGGTWDENYCGTSCGMRFAHCNNVTIKDVTIKNNKNSHHLEIAASENFVIDSCKFSGYKRTNSGDGQAIQIDLMHSSSHFPSYSKYDDTPCKNITVMNCAFSSVYSGVGTRSCVIGSFFDNINIINNRFTNIKDNAICAFNYYNSKIIGNTINKASLGIIFEHYPSDKLVSRYNMPYNKSKAKYKNHDCKSVISGNSIIVRNSTERKNASGILVNGGTITKSLADRYGFKQNNYIVYGIKVMKNSINTLTPGCEGIVFNDVRESLISSNTITSSVKSAKYKNGITLRRSPKISLNKNSVKGKFYNAFVCAYGSKYIKINSNKFNSSRGYGTNVDSSSSVSVYYSNNMSSNAGGKIIINGHAANLLGSNISYSYTSSGKKNYIDIKPVKKATHYRIYRSTTKYGNYKFIKAVTVNKKSNLARYFDPYVTRGKTYYYKVELARTDNGSIIFGNITAPIAIKTK